MPPPVTPATVLTPGVAPRAGSALPTARRSVHVLLVVGGIVLAAVLGGYKLAGWQSLTVLTGSMRPGIVPGQVVLVSPTPVATVRPGEVITFRRPGRAGTTTHRVVRVARAGRSALSVTTKGDANPGPETWTIPDTGTVGRLRRVLPYAGGATSLLVAGHARPYFVGGATALAVVLVLWWVWRPDPLDEDGVDDDVAPAA